MPAVSQTLPWAGLPSAGQGGAEQHGAAGEDFRDNPWGSTEGGGVSAGRVLPETEPRGVWAFT